MTEAREKALHELLLQDRGLRYFTPVTDHLHNRLLHDHVVSFIEGDDVRGGFSRWKTPHPSTCRCH
jgi:hypothetical protein